MGIWKSSIRMLGEPSLGPGTIPSDGATGVRWRFSSDIVFPARKSLPHRCSGAMCISMCLEAGMGLSMDRNGRWWLGLVLAPTRRLSRRPSKPGSHHLVCVAALFDHILIKSKPGTGREVGQPIACHSDHSKRLCTHISLDMASGARHPIVSSR